MKRNMALAAGLSSGVLRRRNNLSAWKQYTATAKPNGMASGRAITPTSLQVQILPRSPICRMLDIAGGETLDI